ncbi:hypothetical protein G3O08_15230 [Cryomorpha ignava]|uniref:DUF4199 domain-containing protein n=1 Tax=Cryomorpha ignava TaxID=101383 RepID=A0A7K3WTN8_9FLAO|nr:hypothetical protein [Cryomorpha ignava]NEN24854.1 hypothetical protein [Cryomorpha ignava]
MSKHPNLNIPVRAALLLIVVRLAFHFADINWPEFQMVYLFIAVGGLIPLCIYAIWPRPIVPPFIKEVATAMRIMAVYAIIMIVFIIVFYAFIDKAYFVEKQTEILQGALETADPSEYGKLKQQVEDFFSLRNFSVLLLIGFVISAGFYALFFTILKQLFLKNKQ